MEGCQTLHGLLDYLAKIDVEIITKISNFILEKKGNTPYKMNGSCGMLRISDQVLVEKIPQAIFYDIFNNIMSTVC